MLSVLEAERLKLARHRATWFLVWIYPTGVTLILLGFALWQLTHDAPPGMPRVPETAASWMQETAFAWGGPASTLGRYMLAAFAAVAFAGEYGWNTWKLIVPHRERVMLMAGKYLTVLGLLAAAMVLTAVIVTVGAFLLEPLEGDGVPRGVSRGGLLAAHGEAVLKALPAVLLTLAYAAAASVLTRSTIAAAIITIVLVTAEGFFGRAAPLLALGLPSIVPTLVHVLPSYHVQNLTLWIEDGRALTLPLGEVRVSHSWPVSLAVVTAWIVGLVTLTVAAFRRQDLN